MAQLPLFQEQVTRRKDRINSNFILILALQIGIA